MNVFLWILQVVLSLLCLAGGAFKAREPGDVAGQIRALPAGAWRALGVFEVVAGVVLLVPAATPFAAAALALENLVLVAVYARYSRKLVAANPLVYAVPMMLIAGFVAYARYALA